MKRLVIILLLILNFKQAFSDNVVLGFGGRDCGWIISEYESNDYSMLAIRTYILGYISGLLSEGDRGGTSSSPQAIIQEALNQCKENPLERFFIVLYRTWLKITNN